ncbi:MAG: hypothetical protein NTX65_10215 [Ignavibacteriales bacterium]|nr:hypothetical protein [Ignavibacteriales bacterium]
MKQLLNNTFIALLVILISSCSHKKDIPETLQNKFEVRSISNDFSVPAINLNERHLKEILILLHNKFAAAEIKEYFKLSDNDYNLCINDLFGEGLIRVTSNGEFAPSCVVINFEDGNKIKITADSLGKEMSLIAIDRLAKIKEACQKIPAFKNISFDAASLFILGNVVHNYWQMPNVADKFIKADPTHRGANRYYLTILENKIDNNSEPFDLFSNRFQLSGNYIFGCYGNRFAKSDSLIKRAELDKLLNDKNSAVPVLNAKDQKMLSDLASIISRDLINYLERNRTLFVKLYLNSIYKDQTSFREWFAWFYQFIITQTTKTLIEKGFIKPPPTEYSEFIFTK